MKQIMLLLDKQPFYFLNKQEIHYKKTPYMDPDRFTYIGPISFIPTKEAKELEEPYSTKRGSAPS